MRRPALTAMLASMLCPPALPHPKWPAPDCMKGLLIGGAHAVIAASSCNHKTAEYCQLIFQSIGSRGSAHAALRQSLFLHRLNQPRRAPHRKTLPTAGLHKATQSALIVGAADQTGRCLLQNLLSSPHFTQVGEYGRHVAAAEQITAGKDKLEQKVLDFEKIEDCGLGSGKRGAMFIA